MIPSLAIVAIHTPGRRPIRFWAPLLLIWIVLAPLALALGVIAAIVCIAAGWRARWALGALWALAVAFAALSGLLVEVRAPRARVLLHLI